MGLGFDSYNSITTIPTTIYLIGAFGGAVLSSSSIDESTRGTQAGFWSLWVVPLVQKANCHIVTEAHQQSSKTALQAQGADISDKVNYATHDDLPGPTTNRFQ